MCFQIRKQHVQYKSREQSEDKICVVQNAIYPTYSQIAEHYTKHESKEQSENIINCLPFTYCVIWNTFWSANNVFNTNSESNRRTICIVRKTMYSIYTQIGERYTQCKSREQSENNINCSLFRCCFIWNIQSDPRTIYYKFREESANNMYSSHCFHVFFFCGKAYEKASAENKVFSN